MLVLSRKVGEAVVVPQCQLTVTVLAVVGNRVRLGLSAPAEIDIRRKEAKSRFRSIPEQPERSTKVG